MKWIEVKIVFDAEDNHLAGELIANLFFEFDLSGVVEADPAIEPVEDWAEDAIARPQQRAVVGYFPKNRKANKRCRDLERQLSLLKRNFTLLYRVSYQELDEEDWAEAWKQQYHLQRIGRRTVIVPAWEEYVSEPG